MNVFPLTGAACFQTSGSQAQCLNDYTEVRVDEMRLLIYFLFSLPNSVLVTVVFVDYFSDELERESDSKLMELRK